MEVEFPRHCSLSRRKGWDASSSLMCCDRQKENRNLGCCKRLLALCTMQWGAWGGQEASWMDGGKDYT